MQLLGQDVLLAIRLLKHEPDWTFEILGKSIGLSASQCHAAFKRLVISKLIDQQQRVPIKGNLFEFCVHGIKYAFPAQLGVSTSGILTAYSSPFMKKKLVGSEHEKVVWKHPSAKTKGSELIPIYKTVPQIAFEDKWMYEILAVLDSIRVGRSREREVAETLLKELIYAND